MTVGVVGDADDAEEVRERLEGHVEVVDPGGADYVVAVGASALADRVAAGGDRPLVAVDVDAAWGVPRGRLEALARTLARGSVGTVRLHSLRLAVGDASLATAVLDATLVTTEPARISEYALSAAGIGQTEFRADGVVAATPLGSAGYARAAGGPRMAPGAGVAVVPIAPFAINADYWVLRPPIDLSVKREVDVTVYADGEAVGSVTPEEALRIRRGDPFRLVAPDAAGRGP